jgi:hypothetical protein
MSNVACDRLKPVSLLSERPPASHLSSIHYRFVTDCIKVASEILTSTLPQYFGKGQVE